MTTEDTGEEDIWVEVDVDGLGEGRRRGGNVCGELYRPEKWLLGS